MRQAAARTAVALLLLATAMLNAPPTAMATEKGRRAWVAAGDSYSSGEGISGTNAVDKAVKHQGKDCARATGYGTEATAYGSAAYQELDEPLGFGFLSFVACTGAVASDLASQFSEAQTELGRSRFDLVTFSFGGNDIGFAEILKGCLDLGYWGAYDLSPGCDIDEPTVRARVDTLRSNLTLVYDLVGSKIEPGGDVVVVGYPQLVEEVGRWESWRQRMLNPDCEGIQAHDVPMLRSATGYLNQQIGAAVLEADSRHRIKGIRFHFLDISGDPYEFSGDPGTRHGLCSSDPWLNGVKTGVSAGDLRIDRSFHPTQSGHTNAGRVLSQLVRNDVSFDDAPPASTTTTTAARPLPEPVLGAAGWATGVEGFGKVRPRRIFYGGSPSGLVDNVQWTSWGGEKAEGVGVALNEAHSPDGTVAGAPSERAHVVAWQLGTCKGKPAYLKVGWYFPGQPWSASDDSYDICTGG
jgi:hypothetical protein